MKIVCAAFAAFLVMSSSMAHAFVELTDAEMDTVTAGSAAVTTEKDIVRFEFSTPLNKGRYVDGGGTLQLRNTVTNNNFGSLVLTDSAQSNLKALVNVNAVNSPVQVLLNLNININSVVNGLRQINITGPLP